jgi:hypothetical protein
VGNDAVLLTTRCAVLALCGFSAEHALAENAVLTLGANAFDLVILDQTLSESCKSVVRAAIPKQTKILGLGELILPRDLERLVTRTTRGSVLQFRS